MIIDTNTARIKNEAASTINITLRCKKLLCIPVVLSIEKKFMSTNTNAKRTARFKKTERKSSSSFWAKKVLVGSIFRLSSTTILNEQSKMTNIVRQLKRVITEHLNCFICRRVRLN
jgi:hypothetical protein